MIRPWEISPPSEVDSHAGETTNVHGITDTSQVVAGAPGAAITGVNTSLTVDTIYDNGGEGEVIRQCRTKLNALLVTCRDLGIIAP